jgi:hypothetical protein
MEYDFFKVEDPEIFKRLAVIQSEFYGWCGFDLCENVLGFNIGLNDVFFHASADSYPVAAEEVSELFDIIMAFPNQKEAYNKIIELIGNKRREKPIKLLEIK